MKLFVILICVIYTCPTLVKGLPGFGVLSAEVDQGRNGIVNFCIKYYPDLYNMTDKASAPRFSFDQFVYLPNVNSCDPEDPHWPQDLSNKFVMVKIDLDEGRGNCSILEQAQILTDKKAVGILTDKPVRNKFNVSEDYINEIVIVSLYQKRDREPLLELEAIKPSKTFFLYAPKDDPKGFDSSLVVILLMAVLTVATGSAWSGYAKKHLFDATQKTHVHNDQDDLDNEDQNPAEDDESIYAHKENRITEEVSVRVTPLIVLAFVGAMCLLLTLLYFFYDQLVYVIISMFCLASFTAIYSCFEPLVMYSYKVFPKCPVYTLPKIKCCGGTFSMELRQFILAILSMSVTIVWAIFRKTSWSWILQDILGIFFAINMLKTLRLPSLKIITVLLCTLFIYDIFFVFVTPLITKNGKSIMVEVATGGSTDEQLPMVLKVPHFNDHPLLCCYESYSMLGFGDILVPGLLVSYCHGYDLQKGTGFWTYWLLVNVCYTLGMVTTFVSLFLMHSAQPALLYLVPFTLVPLYILALIKGDLGNMWRGDYQQQQPALHSSNEENGPSVSRSSIGDDTNVITGVTHANTIE